MCRNKYGIDDVIVWQTLIGYWGGLDAAFAGTPLHVIGAGGYTYVHGRIKVERYILS
jgi:hypothetical protein